jgi:hypothetical protein
MSNEDLEKMVESGGVEDIDIPFDVEDEVKLEPIVEVNNDGSISINKEKFSTLMNVFQIVRFPTCQDADIHHGMLRQYNETRAILIDIDLSAILGDVELKISGLSQKYDLLEPFIKQNVDVVARVDENTYAFMDNISRLTFHQGIGKYMQNKFISDEVFNSRIQPGNRIFEITLGKNILYRLFTYSKSLKADTMNIKFQKTRAFFELSSNDGASPCVVSLIKVEDELEETNIEGRASLLVDPFLSCLSGGITEINMEMFHRANTEKTNEFLFKLTSKLSIGGTDITVPIEMWMLSILKSE